MLTAITLSFLPIIVFFFTFVYFRVYLLASYGIVAMVLWLVVTPFVLVLVDEMKKDSTKKGKKEDEQS